MECGVVLVGGYYRTGASYVASRIAEARPPLFLESDAVGGYPWNRDFCDSLFTEGFPLPHLAGLLRKQHGEVGVYKFTQGALRWKKYIDSFRQHFDLRTVYVVRNPRGVVASHIYRKFPFGFDFESVSQNLARTIRAGWPHNEDNGFFVDLMAEALKQSATPLVTVTQWLAHTYEGWTFKEREASYLVVRYCDLARTRSGWLRVWKFLEMEPPMMEGAGNEWPSKYDTWGGNSGKKAAFRRQTQLGGAADGAIDFVRSLVDTHQSAHIAELMDFAERGRPA